MAEWPTSLPAPQKKISITLGDTRIERRLQSGRTEFRRFGDGKPDQAKVLFRLLWAQWETFKEFYRHDLNLGLNWFSASWLATLGYSEHKAKILGYPREVVKQGYYVDIICILIIQKTAWIIGEDTEWPCESTGGEPPPPTEGILVGFQYPGSSMPTIPPDIVCEKVKSVRKTIIYMKNGSLFGLGETAGLSGYSALGGVIDYDFADYRAMAYLTDMGIVGAIGTMADYFEISSIPSFPAEVITLSGGNGWMAALCSDNSVITWGKYKSVYGIQNAIDVVEMTTGYRNLICRHTDGSISVSGNNGDNLVSHKPTTNIAKSIVCSYQWALMIDTNLQAHYWGTDGPAIAAHHPVGISPVLSGFGGYGVAVCFGIHTDDVLYAWGDSNVPTIPANTTCLDLNSPTIYYSSSVGYVVCILK